MESIFGAEQTIDALCNDIVSHYEKNREKLLTGKVMMVAYSREIAMKIYRKILSIRPNRIENLKEAMLLRQVLSLCLSIVKTEDRLEAAFWKVVRILLTRISSNSHCIP